MLLALAGLNGLLFGRLTASVWRGRDPMPMDARIDGRLDWVPLGPGRLLDTGVTTVVAEIGSPLAVALAALGLLAWTLRRGDARLVKLALLGPVLGTVGAAVVAKPLIGRQLGETFVFPSWHTAAVASLTATLLVILSTVPVDGSRRRRALAGRAGAAALAVLTTAAVGLAVVRLGWHAASDSLGALLFVGVVVPLVAAVCLRVVPADRPVVARLAYRRLGYLVGIGTVGLLGAIRLPYFELSPGSLIPLNSAMTIEEAVAEEAGPLHGTYSGLTVRSTPLTFGTWAWHELTGSPNPIVARELLIPKGEDGKTFRAEQRQVFVSASEVAVAVAEQALGQDVQISGDGALITGILPDGPAAAVLREGDIVFAIDDRPIATETDLRAALGDAAAGADASDPAATVPVTVHVRDVEGATRTERVELRPLTSTGRFGLGVGVTTSNLRFELSTDVAVDGGDVGGPSAGLLTALAVYDALSPEDIAAGRHVTGTGTLAVDGTVGDIGGIEEKVRAAVGAGADVFFAPAGQADDARAAADGRIDVVAVESFDEALSALRTA